MRVYKSVGGIGTITLPPLTVLAGVNGAGKSHLLQAVKEGAVRAYADDDLIDVEDIALYDWTDFAIQGQSTANAWQIEQRRDQLWSTMQNQLTAGKAAQRIKSHPDRLGRQLAESQLLRTPIDELGLPEEAASLVEDERRAIRLDLLEALGGQRELAEAIEHLTGSLIVELPRRRFAGAAEMVSTRVNPLQLRTSELFLAYRSALDRNELLRLQALHEGADVEYLDNDGFTATYGPPPLRILNDLLADLRLDFEVDHPAMTQDSYDVSLTQRTSGVEVPFSDLSSGEKVLMALAISLYGSTENRHRIKLPKLMLLDEIDAPLHPEMTRTYFRVINQLLVSQGVGVVMATHNPSTVALAPEGAIRRMSKSTPRVTEVTRQQALTHLTAGVTALTVRFSERRVVLVEGNADADVYTAVMDALRTHLDADCGIAFVSGGMRAGEGGSQIVRKNVRLLREAGADSIYGLIDRDIGNESADDGSVLVLGPDGRYTIENYLLDPLLLAALAVREKFSDKIEGLDEILGQVPGTWRGLDGAESALLQTVTDHMLGKIHPERHGTGNGTVAAELVGGESIGLPRWFVDAPGHQLADLWMGAIPALRRYRDEAGLRDAVVSLVVADVPELLSTDFLDVMAALAGHVLQE
jgi:hypothetical protein